MHFGLTISQLKIFQCVVAASMEESLTSETNLFYPKKQKMPAEFKPWADYITKNKEICMKRLNYKEGKLPNIKYFTITRTNFRLKRKKYSSLL